MFIGEMSDDLNIFGKNVSQIEAVEIKVEDLEAGYSGDVMEQDFSALEGNVTDTEMQLHDDKEAAKDLTSSHTYDKVMNSEEACTVSPENEEIDEFKTYDQNDSTIKKEILSSTDICEKLNYIIGTLDKLETRMSRLERQSLKLAGEGQCTKNEGENRVACFSHTKTLNENIALSRNMYKMISSFVGEETNECFEKIGETFPITTLTQMTELDQRLQNPDFELRVQIHLRKYSEKLERVFRFIATDNVYIEFNYDGRAGKNPLNTLILYKKILPDVCGGNCNRVIFEKDLRRCVLHAHNRFYKRKKET